jgi:hypothetical protein
MTEKVIAVGTLPGSSVARLKGRARSAMVGALFGSAWMSWAAVFVPAARTTALVLVAVIAILLVGWAAARLRIVRRYKDSAADHERWASVAPLFWIDTTAEWLLGAGAVTALAHFGRYALIPQFLGIIIGLHFLPLAWIFGASRYYIMGTAIVVCVCGSLLIPEGSIRNVIACAGIGLPMWITAVVSLSQD